jgi:hypothetical protein
MIRSPIANALCLRLLLAMILSGVVMLLQQKHAQNAPPPGEFLV